MNFTKAMSALPSDCGHSRYHTIDRFCDAGEGQPSARNSHSLGRRARAACGSQNGRSADAPRFVGFDPKPTF
jgi:hypothetical protein